MNEEILKNGSEAEEETCTGQCGYSPMCRQCELEKKKLIIERYKELVEIKPGGAE
jgi:hypothetical protein